LQDHVSEEYKFRLEEIFDPFESEGVNLGGGVLPPLKNSNQNLGGSETLPLTHNEKNTIYISESGLYE
jgi:hypothetical protein